MYEPLVTLKGVAPIVQSRFSYDGNYVLTGHDDSQISIFNARDNGQKKTQIAKYGTSSNCSLSSLTVSPSSETFLTTGLTPTHMPSSIIMYSISQSVQNPDNPGNHNYTTLQSTNGHTPAPRHLSIPSINSTCYSSNEKIILSAGFDGKVLVWDVRAPSHAHKITGCSPLSLKPSDSLNFVDFAAKSDDKIIVTASSSGCVTFYDMRNSHQPLGSTCTKVNVQGSPIVTNVVHRNGMVWACCLDNSIKCFDYQKTKENPDNDGSFLDVVQTYEGSHKATAFSALTCSVAPSMKHVVVGSEDDDGAAVYAVTGGKLIQKLQNGAVHVEFARSEEWIATGGYGKSESIIWKWQ